jgi:predicted MFS family arabinose efflux permease
MTLPACPDSLPDNLADDVGATPATALSARAANRASTATLLAACLAMGGIAMTITSSSVALAGVQADLRLGITQLQWVLNSFIVSFALLLLPFGWLSDRIGPRSLFLLGTLVFVLGASLAVLAAGLPMLLAGRLLQGVGGALLTATAPAALTTAFSLEAHRKRAFGYLGASGGIGLTLGALLAGAVSSWGGWRAAFSLPIPVIVAAFLITLVSRDALARACPNSARSDISTLSLWRNRQFVLACLACLLFTTVWVALFIYAPLHMQSADGLTPRAAGTTMLALMLPALVMPVVASRLVMVFHIGTVLIAGFFAIALGLWIMDLGWSDPASRWAEVIGLALCGIGAGTLYGLVDYLGLTAVPAQQAGAAAGAFNVVRLLGDILAALIPGAVVLHAVRKTFASYSSLDITSEALNEISAGGLRAVEHLGLTSQAHAAFAAGMSDALWVLIALATMGTAVAVLVRKTVARH